MARTVKRDALLGVTRELATLLRAGLPLDRALEVLISLAPTPPWRDCCRPCATRCAAASRCRRRSTCIATIFSRFYVNIVRAGEAGGALGVVLTRLADTMERNKELRESVKAALIYPTILIGVAVTSVMVLLVFVVPQFQQTFAQAGKALPLPTEIVIVVGTALRKYWWLMILTVVASVWIMRRRLQSPAVRYRWDGRLLRAPLIGDLMAKVEVARFSRTLATLLGNGVTLLAGLAIVKETMTNTVLAQALEGVITCCARARVSASRCRKPDLYPRLATQMILVGEESGRLEEMLTRVSEVYDREVQIAIKRFLAVLEPVLILGLAVFIGGIVFSILLGVWA